LPVASKHRKIKVKDFSSVPEREVLYAMVRLQEIREGGDFMVEMKRDGLQSRTKYGSSATDVSTGVTQEFAESIGAIWGETRYEALVAAAESFGVSWETFKNNYIAKGLLYDLSKEGDAVWIVRSKDKTSMTTIVQRQIGGPLGAAHESNKGGVSMASSHINPTSAQSIVSMKEEARFIVVDVALRAVENVLRSPDTIRAFARYVIAYAEFNKKHITEIVDAVNDAISTVTATTVTYQIGDIYQAEKELVF